MKNIITIQHTQSTQHTNGMFGSWDNWDLTEHGIEQAKRIGECLLKEIKNHHYIMCSSDLLRAKHTAEIVTGSLEIELIFTNMLREFNLGEAVGKSKEWARKNVKCPVWPETIDWAKTIDGKPFVGAESKRDVWNRVLHFYNRIMNCKDQNIMIVSHGGTLSIFFQCGWVLIFICLTNTICPVFQAVCRFCMKIQIIIVLSPV